ncbi:hypothetical protein [Nitrosopumilus sp.]|uniref:hypothetical protein n=1 Tax=Nitrosopumilus sp. TaxID=2024843 RepID=UPI00262D6144|nr:hypothetical protein [Nitrosopumilus sp.]
MKTITTFALLLLVASIGLGGITNSASAQDDPAILLKLAKRAQDQISNQISENSPDKIKRMFNQGVHHVESLEKAIRADDVESAKEHFLSAMKVFKEISRNLSASDSVSQAESTAAATDVRNPTSDLKRLFAYVESLKNIAKKHDAAIDFSTLDRLFTTAIQQIRSNEYQLAFETLHEIKQEVIEVKKELRDKASQQESERAKHYAQKYLEQLDRLIEHAKKQGVSAEIIEKLETAKENLSSADNPAEIVKEIRKIMSIKDQFELTKNDRLESRVLQVEKIISRLAQVDGVDTDLLEDARSTLQSIKNLLADGEFDEANQQLRDLANQLKEIKNSTR